MRIDSAIITGSFSVNGDTFNDLGAYTTTGSNIFVGNQSIVGAVSASALTGSISYTNLTDVPTLVSGSEQIVGILSSLNSYTQSNDTTNTTQNSRLNSLENKTGSLATTGSNTFYGTQIFSGSLFVQDNLVVQGSSSLQNITASAVSIGTNTVVLNTANPSVRFGGLSVVDSGSAAGKSGSLYFDSTDDEWVFVHAGNTAVTSSIMITGPETYDNIGNETRLTTNVIPKIQSGFHIVDSCIIDNGTTTCVKNNLIGTGTIQIGGASISGNSNSFYNATNETSVAIKQTCGAAQIGLAIWNDGTTGDNKFVRFFGETSATNRGSIQYDRTGNRLNIIGENCGLLFTGISNFNSQVCAPYVVASCFEVGNGQYYTARRNSGNLSIDLLGIESGTDDTRLLITNDFNITNGSLTKVFSVKSNGNVGINTTSPFNFGTGHKTLDIRGDSTTSIGALFVGNCDRSSVLGFYINPGAGGTVGTSSNHYLQLVTCDVERIRITTGGNVGINESSPSSLLHFSKQTIWGSSDNRIININNTGTGGDINQPHNMGSITWYSGNSTPTAEIAAYRNTPASGNNIELRFYTATAGTPLERMRIMSYGSIGIATASPNASSPLHVKMCSNSNGDGIRVQAICSGGAGSQPGIAFANTSDCKRWNIAMDTSSDTLQITNAGGSNVFNVTQNCVVCLGPVTTIGMQGGADTTVISGGSGYGSAISMKYANGAFNNYLAGNGDNYFNCVTGKINAQGGVKFGSGASTLNYYEQGSWTPRLKNGSFTSNAGTSNTGWYTRIGNIVTVGGTLDWTGGSGAQDGNSLQITCLPFASDSTTNTRNVGQIGAPAANSIGFVCSGKGQFTLVIDPGNVYMYVIEIFQNGTYAHYTHAPTVASSGTIYGFQATYHI